MCSSGIFLTPKWSFQSCKGFSGSFSPYRIKHIKQINHLNLYFYLPVLCHTPPSHFPVLCFGLPEICKYAVISCFYSFPNTASYSRTNKSPFPPVSSPSKLRHNSDTSLCETYCTSQPSGFIIITVIVNCGVRKAMGSKLALPL